jgi:hypothetical protein
VFPHLLAQSVETTSEPDQWIELAFIPFAGCIDLVRSDVLQQDLSDKQVVIANMMESHDFTLQIHRAFCDDRRFNILGW